MLKIALIYTLIDVNAGNLTIHAKIITKNASNWVKTMREGVYKGQRARAEWRIDNSG